MRRSLSTKEITKVKRKDPAIKQRHTSLPPNIKAVLDLANRPKTFFKGAVEFVQHTERSSLADNDDTLRKILDDSAVVSVFEDRQKLSVIQDYVNKGLLPESALKK